jgi:glycosyltransferase 2 family protein
VKNLLKNKIVVTVLKFALAAGILAWVIYGLVDKEEKRARFFRLLSEPKDWTLIALGSAILFFGVLATFVRWQLLVRALGIPFTLRDGLRLGFLGYLFNFVGPGGVGGDLFKAVFIAREHRERRSQAVATVFIDRVVGLYALFLVAATAVLTKNLWFAENDNLRKAAQASVIGTIVGAIFIVMMLFRGFTNGKVSQFLGSLPRTGHIFRQLIDAVRLYRERIGYVVVSLVISLGVHICSVACFYVLGKAMPGIDPTPSELFVIVPLAMMIGAFVPTPGSVGALEAAVELLYVNLGGAGEGRGLMITLLYRLVTIAIALIGLVIYRYSRREVDAALHEIEDPESAQPSAN